MISNSKMLRSLIAAGAVLLSGRAVAATYYVSPSGSNSSPGTSASPFLTLQRGVDVSAPGDTIIVKDGNYASGTTINKAGTSAAWITIRAENKWKAVLNCNTNCHSLFSLGSASAYWVIQGFDMSNGRSAGVFSNSGGGKNIRVLGNHIHHIGNVTDTSSIGIMGVYTDTAANNWTIDGNVIHDCGRTGGRTGSHDHGLYLHGTNFVITNNVFYRVFNGWHIQTANTFSGRIVNNTFYQPDLYPGKLGSIVLWEPNSNVIIRNNIFYDSGAVAIYTYALSMSGSCSIDNNIVYRIGGVPAIIDSLPAACTASNNRLTVDPLLVNPAGLDFHLRAGSPAINTASASLAPATDHDGAARPQSGAYDVGAFEYGGTAPVPPPPAPTGCIVSASAWQNSGFAAQTGSFSLSFDAVPGAANIDGVSGLSNGAASSYSALAAAVRFNNAGTIDARNGAAYGAAASIPYVSGLTYRFRLAVNLASRTYSAYVKQGANAELLIGSGYAFRSEQAGASTLNNLGLFASSGSEQVCAVTVGAGADATPPVISAVAVSAVGQTGATVGWTTSEAADTQVEYGPTTAYGASSPLNSALTTAHAVALSGLTAGTLYHYRVKSKDAAGNAAVSADLTFTTASAADTTAPVITAVAASGVTQTGAAIGWTTNEASDTQVEYGPTTAYGASTLLNSALTTSHGAALSGLTAGTLYHYRVKSRDAAGNLGTSPDATFTTSAGTVEPGCISSAGTWKNAPIAAQSGTFTAEFDAVPGATGIDGVSGLSNGPAASYTALAAAVRFNNAGTIDARNGGSYAAAASIPYAAGLKYRFRLAVNLTSRTYSAYVRPGSAAEVLIGSGYAFRTEQASASTLNNVGLLASTGSEQVCAVVVAAAGDTTAPVISGVAASAVSQTGATIGWLTNETSDSQVEYGLTTAYGASTLANPSLVTSHGASLTGLVPGTLYHYRVKSKDAAGNLATSADAVFTTAAAPAACASSSGTTWANTPLPPQSGSFIVEFDGIPGAANIDGVMGLSNGPAADYAKLAAIVRFSTAGTIDARNAGAYVAAASIPYAAGLTYRFRLEVSLTARKYSAYVRQGANAERLIGSGYSFRTEQSGLTTINNLGLNASTGSAKVCAVTVR